MKGTKSEATIVVDNDIYICEKRSCPMYALTFSCELKLHQGNVQRESRRGQRGCSSESEVNFWHDLTNKVVEAPTIKPLNNILDTFWSTLNIKYNFENCVEYEKNQDESKLCRKRKK